MEQGQEGGGQRWVVIGTIGLVVAAVAVVIVWITAKTRTQLTDETSAGLTTAPGSLTPQTGDANLSKQSGLPIDNNTLTYTETAVVADPNAPMLTKILETTIVGSNLWLHPVPDGSSSVLLSSEPNGTIALTRWDPNAPTKTPVWTTVASSDDTGGSRIADHWHIFAHNAHWIAFSISEANRSFLLKIDQDLKRQCLAPVVEKAELSDAEQTSIAADLPPDNPNRDQNQPVVTNDMWLVAEPNGVAVGHFVPGYGSKIYRFDTDCRATGTALVGGGNYLHGSGSAAELADDGFLLFGAETLNGVATGAIRLIKTDFDWRPQSAKVLLFEDGTNLAMPSSVKLPNGYRIINLRATVGASKKGVMPPPPQPGALPDDSAAIVRYVLAPDDTVVERTVLQADDANRPHTALFGDRLLTGWDGPGLILRVDRIQSNKP